MVKVVFLGNCANQTDSREGVSFIVDANDDRILIDAGPGVVRQIYRAGYQCTDIDKVIITHCHGDHTLGYPYFIFSHFYEGLKGVKGPNIIHVLGIRSVLDGLNNMLHFCYVPEKYPFKIKEIEVDSNGFSTTKLENYKIVTAPVVHSTPNIGVRIEVMNKVICYSSDTLYSDNVIDLSNKADLLIHEGFATAEMEATTRKIRHGIAREAGQVAQKANAKMLALVHIFPPFIGRENELIGEARSFFNGHVFVPNELDVIKLK